MGLKYNVNNKVSGDCQSNFVIDSKYSIEKLLKGRCTPNI